MTSALWLICLSLWWNPVFAAQSTTSSNVQNPWGLKLLAKPVLKKLPTQQQQQPQRYDPATNTYLPSQLNPPSNYQSPATTPNYGSDIWSTWNNLGGAFRYSPDVDYSYGMGSVIVAFNSAGTLKAKTVSRMGISSWVTIAYQTSAIVPESRPAVVVNSNTFQVFMVGVDGFVYRLATAGSLPLSTTTVTTWTAATTSSVFINDPAVVLAGNYYFLFVVNRNDRKIYYASYLVTPLPTLALAALTSDTFSFSPTASTYQFNGATHVVVAGVGFNGALSVLDSIATTNTLTASTMVFTPADVSCIESPQSVSLPDRVEIYCRGRDMNFYCVTVMQGAVADVRILPEADLPEMFTTAYDPESGHVMAFTRTPAGRVVSKIFQ